MGSDSLIKGNSRIGGFFIYHYDRAGSFRVKGIFYKKNSLVKSHILGYDGGDVQLILVGGVWKPPKLTKFGQKLCSLRFLPLP